MTQLKHISYFGGVDDGDGHGGGTPNEVAFQDMAYWMQDNRGGELDFSPTNTGCYRQDEPVTLLHQDNSNNRNYILRSNRSFIDCSNMSGGDVAWTIGGASLACFMEESDWRIDLRLKGPGAANYDQAANPTTETTGFKLQFISRANLDELTAHGFRKGVHSTWALYNRGWLNVRRNTLGLHLDAVSNMNNYSVHGVNCRTSVALAPTQFADIYDSGKINGNIISDIWAEGSDNALWLDGGTVQGTPIVFGNEFHHLYVAALKKSAARLGYAFSFDSGSVVTSPGAVTNNKIASKFWNPPVGGYASGRHAIDIAPGLRVGGLEVDIPVPYGTSEAFNNRPAGGSYRLWEAPKADGSYLYRGLKTVTFDATGNIVPPVNG